jgi:hypothetical protein
MVGTVILQNLAQKAHPLKAHFLFYFSQINLNGQTLTWCPQYRGRIIEVGDEKSTPEKI